MIEAGVIGVKLSLDDSGARAAAARFVADIRSQVSQISVSPVLATAGGGFFNRTGGGGQVTGATGGSGGFGGGGGFRLPSFDREADMLKGSMVMLGHAMREQFAVLTSLTTSMRTSTVGFGGGSFGGLVGANVGAIGSVQGFGGSSGSGTMAGLVGQSALGGGEAALAGGAAAGEGVAVAGAAGAFGAGKSFARLGARLGRAGGFAIAAYGVHHLVNTLRENYLFDEKVDRMLAVGDQEGASQAILEKAKSKREGLAGIVRSAFSYVGGTDYAAAQERAQQDLDTLHADKARDQVLLESRRRDRSSQLHLLSGYRASMGEASDLQTSAHEDAEKLRQQARHNSSSIAKGLLNFAADQLERSAAKGAYAVRWKAKEDTDTTMIGLRGTLEEQLELNKLHPGQAHAMGIYNDTALNVRDLLIHSTRENAEYARRIGIAQLKGFELQTIMSGNASAFDPFLEMAGPTSSKNTESMNDIMNKVYEEIKALRNSLQDIGQTTNPGDE